MKLSQMARSIAPSPTLRLNEQARLLRERGEPVIHLGVGEPKNKAPRAAIERASALLEGGYVKYGPTAGQPALREAIAGYTETFYGRRIAPENTIVSASAKQSIYNALVSVVNPGDEVIILAPYWVSYPEMVRLVYGVPVIVPLRDAAFEPQIAAVEAAVSDATRAIIVNSPNNPSGAVYSSAFVAALVDLAERHDLYLIMDDIYHQLVFDGSEAPSAYRFTQRDVDDSTIIVINGISKSYGMTGFRIGWAVAARQVVEVMTAIQGQIITCPSPLTQAAAEGALTGSQEIVEDLRRTMQANRDAMLDELHAIPGVRVTRPAGTFYCLPDFSAYNPSSEALSDMLLHKALVVTVPGKAFGAEGHLRLSFSGNREDLIEGIRRIKWALDPSGPNEIYIGDHKIVRD
ncbi:MAG TPA: pyridoxal phosphate-dependent aminotransferase [Aggregatilinea sp.]|jgi:aspartate aminotransferase|uniref:pyridoxal phosphate-dependent aminotransferase n=1 Tax=Aggregatilinea sp. TaxID=2806333 RepID=UPI002CFF52E7|nr:pyridoxal phosphate-dependent aminotransferase [Aggregatilinea sp.]HML22479.1 pyridoxal phosphate-dependent aminotransferase [Aggregatilinea sp.]